MTKYSSIVGVAAVVCLTVVFTIISLREVDTVGASRKPIDHQKGVAHIGRPAELTPPRLALSPVEQSAEISIGKESTDALAHQPASSLLSPNRQPRFATAASNPIDSVGRPAEATRRGLPTSFAHPTERADKQIVSEMVSALTVELDYGIPLPVVLLVNDQPVTFAQASAESRITSEFAQNLRVNGKPANAKEPGGTEPRLPAQNSSDTRNAPLTAEDGQIEDVYIDAQLRADERYRLLYGDTAYIHQAIKAARAALTEE